MSLNDAYKIGYDHAIKNIEKNGGSVSGDNVTIKTQQPVAVKFEKSFDGIYPIEKKRVDITNDGKLMSFSFRTSSTTSRVQ